MEVGLGSLRVMGCREKWLSQMDVGLGRLRVMGCREKWLSQMEVGLGERRVMGCREKRLSHLIWLGQFELCGGPEIGRCPSVGSW